MTDYDNYLIDNNIINNIINNLTPYSNIEAFYIIQNNASVLNYLIRTIDYTGDMSYGDILNNYCSYISNLYLINNIN